MPEPAPNGLILYDAVGSPCGRRVRMTLHEKGLDYRHVLIDLAAMQQKSPEYLALNPNGIVPTLAHGERVIYESNVITEYLDRAFDQCRLYPDDPWRRAEVRMWQLAELAMAKDFRPVMYMRLMGPLLRLTTTLDEAVAAARAASADPAVALWEEKVWRLEVLTPVEEQAAERRLRRWLDMLNDRLTSSPFLAGGRFCQAELSVYPRVAMFPAIRIPIDTRHYPAVADWLARVGQRPCFDATLTDQERGFQKLAGSPLLAKARRIFDKPSAARSLAERAFVGAAGFGLRRVIRRARARQPQTKTLPRPEAAGRTPSLREFTHPGRALDETLTLFGHRALPECRRVLELLHDKALEVDWVDIDPLSLAQYEPAFLALSPLAILPTLRHGERVVWGADIVAEYVDALAANADGGRWFPADANKRNELRMWLALEDGTHKEFTPLWQECVFVPSARAVGAANAVAATVDPDIRKAHARLLADGPRYDSDAATSRAQILLKLDRLEDRLATAPWLVGDAPSFADLAWGSRLAEAPALGLDLSTNRFAHLRDWLGRTINDYPGLGRGQLAAKPPAAMSA